MCGRYVARKLRWTDYAAEPRFEEFSERRITPRFNVAPSQTVPIVRLDKDARRVGDLVHWGLIPSWTKGTPKLKPINARVETVATSAMFRQAFTRRRCLQVADGFYEWKPAGKVKQPHFIRLVSDEPFAFAGLWERWRPGDDVEPVNTCCHITTTPNELMAPIHDRMPVILLPADYAAWLDPDAEPDQLHRLLRPLPAELMKTYAVSTAVNRPANDSAANVEPRD